MLKARLELLSQTNMVRVSLPHIWKWVVNVSSMESQVDYAVDIYKQLHQDDDAPAPPGNCVPPFRSSIALSREFIMQRWFSSVNPSNVVSGGEFVTYCIKRLRFGIPIQENDRSLH